MPTQAQIEANRRNSQKSTGPRTEAGKLTCSQNAFKSGVYAEAPLVTGENPVELDTLALAYRAAWRPSQPDEHALVETLVHTEWLTRRMRRVETQLWNRRTDGLHEDSWYQGDPAYELAATWSGIQEQLDRVQRRLSSLERIYRRTLADLRRLRADRPLPAQPEPDLEPARPITSAPAIGFVPPETLPPPSPDVAAAMPPDAAPSFPHPERIPAAIRIGFVPPDSRNPVQSPANSAPSRALHSSLGS